MSCGSKYPNVWYVPETINTTPCIELPTTPCFGPLDPLNRGPWKGRATATKWDRSTLMEPAPTLGLLLGLLQKPGFGPSKSMQGVATGLRK